MAGSNARVDGEYLVIPTKTAMPERCVKSNEPVAGQEYRIWNLFCISDKYLLVAFIFTGPLVFLMAAYSGINRCKFKAGLSKKYSLRYALPKIVLILLVCCSFAVGAQGMNIQSSQLTLLGFKLMLFFFYLFIVAHLFYKPLKVVKEKDGMYWIKGCSEEYLASLHVAQNEPLGGEVLS